MSVNVSDHNYLPKKVNKHQYRMDDDPRAVYALLEFESDQCEATIHRIAYDREAVITELKRIEHPAQDWISQIFRNADV